MGSKISLLVYEWIWYMNRSIFQNFPKIGSSLRAFWENCVILLKIQPKIEQCQIGIWVTFSLKICMGLLSNSGVAHPYQNQTWVPPWGYRLTEQGRRYLSKHHNGQKKLVKHTKGQGFPRTEEGAICSTELSRRDRCAALFFSQTSKIPQNTAHFWITEQFCVWALKPILLFRITCPCIN